MLLALNRLSVVLKNSFLITVKKQELPWERRLFNVSAIHFVSPQVCYPQLTGASAFDIVRPRFVNLT